MRDFAQERRSAIADMLARTDAIAFLGWLLFVVATLAFWTQLQPFRSLQDYELVQDVTQSNDLRKYTTLLISALVIVFLWADGKGQRIFDVVKTPIIFCVLAWSAFTSIISPNPGLAMNRLILAAIIVQIAYAVPFLFKDIRSFVHALGFCVTVVVVASYVGIAVVPDLATHTIRDVTEQTLAGDWRGIFAHKNDLSAMAALFIFLGVLMARIGNPIWGVFIVAASTGLLIMSGGKTSLLVTIPSLFAGLLVVRLRSTFLSATLAYGLVLTLVFFTLGGVLFPQLQPFFNSVLPDPSFTGRTDAWKIAVTAIGHAKVFGYGYMIFWDLGLIYSITTPASYVATFSHAHNGFLDTTLSSGFIGLALVVVWTVILPFRQIRQIGSQVRDGTEYAFVGFLTNVWLFGLMNSSLEAILFNRSNPVWYTMLIALGCLHAWSQAIDGRDGR